MKKSKVLNLISVLKIIIIIAFLVGALVVALYPFKNQDVMLKLDTAAGTVSYSMSADEIASTNEFVVPFPDIEDIVIKEIRMYRSLKTICIEKIQSTNFENYMVIGKDKITFNVNSCNLLRRLSCSFFMERLLCIEVILAVCMFLWILTEALNERMNPESRNNHGPIFEVKRFFKDMIKYKEYVFFAAKADLKAEVANSYLNRLWWLLEPFFNMLVYVLVFGRVMGQSVRNYSTFVFSALLMFNYFSKTINYSVKCVRNNRDIVTKVYIPKYILLISNMILNFYKLLFSMLVLVVMMFVFKIQIGWNIFWVIPAYLLMFLLAFGVGMIFLHYGVYVDDLGYAVGILLQMLMFLSGEFYDVITSLHTPLNVMMLCLNPAAMFIDTMRNALLYNVAANLPLIGLWMFISILLCYLGVHIVYKNENGYVKVV